MMGEQMDITIQFLRAGYVVIRCNESEFVYENKRLTGWVPPSYASGLPANAFITIVSDGGQWSLVYGHPKSEGRGTLLSQPIEIPFAFDLDEVEYEFEGDDAMPDVGVDVALFGLGDNLYQLQVDMTSDGRYTPEVYRVGFRIPAGATSDFTQVLWDSQTPGNPYANSGNFIKDITVEDDCTRSRKACIHVALSSPEADPPLNPAGLACNIEYLDRELSTTRRVLTMGKVVAVPFEGAKEIDSATGFAVTPDVGAEMQLNVVGMENFLDVEMAAIFPFNGKFPNDCMRAICRDMGLPPEQYSDIPGGDIGIERIPPARAGRFPDAMPALGARALEVLKDLADKHCPGWSLGTNTTSLELVPNETRDRAELAYGNPPTVPVDSKLCLRNRWKLVQDLREFYTGVTAIGAKDPATGQRFTATETIPQAFTPGFEDSMFWTGQERHLTLSPDESLKSKTACLRVAREKLGITRLTPQGRPPWFAEVVLDYDDTVRMNDLPRVFGIKFVVIDMDFASLAAGEDAQKMRQQLQLAEDVRPPEGP